MKMTDNTMLITGGGTGIGRALAEAFHAHGNTVIIAGRRQEVLDEVTAAHPGMTSVVLDIEDAESVRTVAARLARDFPALNVLVNNAGIMRHESVTAPAQMVEVAEATVATNLLGPIRLTAALLPQLQAQPHSAVLNVTSGLAFVPLAVTPTYSATKAALHAYTQSLRFQLAGSSTQVIELIPPQVATELTPGQSTHPQSMPLGEYVGETMSLLRAQPDADEIHVERVRMLSGAAASSQFEQVFGMLNGRH